MRLAAIDIGTNSIHMIVCRIRPDLSFEVIDREKDMVRLGAGGLEGGQLAPSAVSAAMQTLAKFRRLAESHGVDETIAAATSAVREAENGGDFLAAVRRDVGIHVRVISGTEEARLIHQAAAYAVDIGRRAAIVIDIGGGSTEITLGTATRVQFGRSFKLGAIRLTERFAKSDPLSDGDDRRLTRHITRETKAYLRQLRQRGFHRVIGTSGTILSLGCLTLGARPGTDVHHAHVSAKAIHRLRERLAAMPLDERLRLSGLDPRRADLIVAGAVLLDVVLDGLSASELTLCDFALREGLILDYVKKNAAHIRAVDRIPDVRRRSVLELAERCGMRLAHGQQVARLGLTLFDKTRSLHHLGTREREWLEYAALLHDIGTHISYERHHKHSYYLIKNGDLRGFDPEEVEIIALAARYHRQALPKKSHEGYADLTREQRETVRLLGAFVRLAEGLDRSDTQVVTRLDIAGPRGRLVVHLRARGDASLELWAAHRHGAALAELLKREIQFDLGGELATAAVKDTSQHAHNAQHAPHLSRPAFRGRRHRRLRKNDAARPARQVARGDRASRVRH
jgi:exopolyphosphatase / guanosine-5'-triphosphate,3'-diphosphate pyrophosphatase